MVMFPLSVWSVNDYICLSQEGYLSFIFPNLAQIIKTFQSRNNLLTHTLGVEKSKRLRETIGSHTRQDETPKSRCIIPSLFLSYTSLNLGIYFLLDSYHPVHGVRFGTTSHSQNLIRYNSSCFIDPVLTRNTGGNSSHKCPHGTPCSPSSFSAHP